MRIPEQLVIEFEQALLGGADVGSLSVFERFLAMPDGTDPNEMVSLPREVLTEALMVLRDAADRHPT